MDIEKLMTALDNENNEELLNLDNKKISKMKNDILQKLGLNRIKLKEFHTKLKNYRYVDELPDIKYGAYIRWISLRKLNDLKLTTGGFLCEISVKDDGIHLVCRNSCNRYFQIRMVENVIFQKLSVQEMVLLNVMDSLSLSCDT